MFNQDKVRLMTKIASYEKRADEDLTTNGYFKADYVAYNSFLMLVGVTVSLLFFFIADFGAKFFEDMQAFIEYDFMDQGMDYLTVWLVFMVVYGVIGSVVYRKRYNTSKRRIDIYKKMLKDLRKM